MWENRLLQERARRRRAARSTWATSRCRCCTRSPSTTTSCRTTPRSRWSRSSVRRTRKKLVLKGGHVSLVAGGNAIKRLWPKLDAWLAKAFGMTSNEARSYPAQARLRRRRNRVAPDDAGRRRARCSRSRRSCSTHDLLFLRRDISQPKVVAAWMDATRNGLITTLLAHQGRRRGRLRDHRPRRAVVVAPCRRDARDRRGVDARQGARPEADAGVLRHRARAWASRR